MEYEKLHGKDGRYMAIEREKGRKRREINNLMVADAGQLEKRQRR